MCDNSSSAASTCFVRGATASTASDQATGYTGGGERTKLPPTVLSDFEFLYLVRLHNFARVALHVFANNNNRIGVLLYSHQGERVEG